MVRPEPTTVDGARPPSTFRAGAGMLPRMTPDTDPRPSPPPEPALEDCCGTGCAVCVFDAYRMALENHERALRAWEARHPGANDGVPGPATPAPSPGP